MCEDNMNEKSVDNLEKQIQNIFKRLKNYNQKDYLEIMTLIEFYKSKYFIMSHKPKKTFREYLK